MTKLYLHNVVAAYGSIELASSSSEASSRRSPSPYHYSPRGKLSYWPGLVIEVWKGPCHWDFQNFPGSPAALLGLMPSQDLAFIASSKPAKALLEGISYIKYSIETHSRGHTQRSKEMYICHRFCTLENKQHAIKWKKKSLPFKIDLTRNISIFFFIWFLLCLPFPIFLYTF